MCRRAAWSETDAAGHTHFSAPFRWLEEAEHELFRRIGADPEMIPRLPRVHIDIDYRSRLLFNQLLWVRVAVLRVGRSSCTLSFSVVDESWTPAVIGTYVIVHAASTSTGSSPWPDDVRAGLTSDAVYEAGLTEFA
jgi:acyl-CoA thioester hydrolase